MLTAPQRTLIAAGASLFLLGLLQGAAVQMFANPRMALSAHLTAVQSGTALMVAGVVWTSVSLWSSVDSIARTAILLGMFGLWIGLTLSAATGASQALPIAGAGHSAGLETEALVSFVVLGSSGVLTAGWALFVGGLIRSFRQ